MRDGIGVSLPYKQERGHERKEREKKKAERIILIAVLLGYIK